MRSIVSCSFVLATMSLTTVASASPAAVAPNPLALYPRRPGAKFEDTEARPHEVVRVPIISPSVSTLGFDVSLERWTREPAAAVPIDWHYADVNELERANHADGFVPHPAPASEVLHLVLRVRAPASTDLIGEYRAVCTVTDPTDGTQFLPFLPELTFGRATATSSTTVPSASSSAIDTDAFVAIGPRRGPMYVRCGIDTAVLPSETRVVWRIDVP
jgi:hypothetical protein